MTRLGANCAACDHWVPLGASHQCNGASSVLTLEPAPGSPRIAELVMTDLAKTRTPLPWARRDHMLDAYREALDLTLALRLALFERDGR